MNKGARWVCRTVAELPVNHAAVDKVCKRTKESATARQYMRWALGLGAQISGRSQVSVLTLISYVRPSIPASFPRQQGTRHSTNIVINVHACTRLWWRDITSTCIWEPCLNWKSVGYWNSYSRLSQTTDLKTKNNCRLLAWHFAIIG